MKKRTLALLLTLTLALGLSAGAFAASNSQTISALLNRDLKIVYNGVEQNMTDASGKAVYPISYNNTTYLPVRAVSAMVGLPIEFDANTNSVLLGSKAVQPANLVDLTNSGGTDYSSIIRDAEELKVQTADGLQTYTTGIKWRIWNGTASTGILDGAILFNVNGYQTVSFTAWSDIFAKVIVCDQDGKVIDQFTLDANTTVTKTLSLDANTSQISFSADGNAGSKGVLKILDPAVQ